MPTSLRVVVPPHPLIAHWLTILRNSSTPSVLYATALGQLGKWLTYEALREWLPHKKELIETANGSVEGTIIQSDVEILSVPELPGGLELWQGAREVLPNASLCIGGLPKEISNNSGIIFYIDQITTGKKLLNQLLSLKRKNVNPKRIRVITALASNPGLKTIGEKIKDLNIFCACIDQELQSDKIILPGIGDPSNRINTRLTITNED